ncbi:MAG: AAA family ATPase [Bacteroidota bacterium]
MPIKSYKTQDTTFKTDDYILHEALESAVEVALALGQPLLLTGEPGTGKTKLAYKVAADLAGDGFAPKPLVFNTKTTSLARDLFYTYDAVAHFQAANIKRSESDEAPETADFIELQALGKAIALSHPKAVDRDKIREQLPTQPQNSVVLIDEIDKAPRDFTNDILNEIEAY